MAEWYYAANRKQTGPVPWEELQRLARAGLLEPTDLVWSAGMTDWARASTRRELFAGVPGAGDVLAPLLAARVVEIPTDREPVFRGGQPGHAGRSEHDLYDGGDRPTRPRRSLSRWPVSVRIGLMVGGIVLVLLILGIALFVLTYAASS